MFKQAIELLQARRLFIVLVIVGSILWLPIFPSAIILAYTVILTPIILFSPLQVFVGSLHMAMVALGQPSLVTTEQRAWVHPILSEKWRKRVDLIKNKLVDWWFVRKLINMRKYVHRLKITIATPSSKIPTKRSEVWYPNTSVFVPFRLLTIVTFAFINVLTGYFLVYMLSFYIVLLLSAIKRKFINNEDNANWVDSKVGNWITGFEEGFNTKATPNEN